MLYTLHGNSLSTTLGITFVAQVRVALINQFIKRHKNYKLNQPRSTNYLLSQIQIFQFFLFGNYSHKLNLCQPTKLMPDGKQLVPCVQSTETNRSLPTESKHTLQHRCLL